jgi:nucleotide-binding universal stress UspA family protein
MKQINKILVPVDFSGISEAALLTALTLVKKLDGELHLIHVISFNPNSFAVLPETQLELSALKDIEAAVSKKMKELSAFVKSEIGAEPHSIFVTGDVHNEIVNYSDQNEIDLIVMGTHGVSGYKELFIGSNAHKVVTLSNVHVLTLQSNNDGKGFNDILIPIGDSLLSREKVKIAIQIAKLFDATIHVVGIAETTGKNDLHKVEIKSKSLEVILKDEEVKYTRTIISASNTAQGALKIAEEKNCDLIIINSGQESKITGVFLGVFAQQIVNHSLIPVLNYKNSTGDYKIETPGFGI